MDRSCVSIRPWFFGASDRNLSRVLLVLHSSKGVPPWATSHLMWLRAAAATQGVDTSCVCGPFAVGPISPMTFCLRFAVATTRPQAPAAKPARALDADATGAAGRPCRPQTYACPACMYCFCVLPACTWDVDAPWDMDAPMCRWLRLQTPNTSRKTCMCSGFRCTRCSGPPLTSGMCMYCMHVLPTCSFCMRIGHQHTLCSRPLATSVHHMRRLHSTLSSQRTHAWRHLSASTCFEACVIFCIVWTLHL